MSHLVKLDGRAFGAMGLLILATFCGIALLADLLSPHLITSSHQPYMSPSWEHPLGTNDMGYDIFSELLHASRVSLIIGILAAFVSIIIGTMVGLLSGYYKGMTSEAITGVIDIFLLIPVLPVMVILAAYLGASIWNIIFVIAILGWCSTARVVRARVLQLREMPFVESLRALAIPGYRILVGHVLPNTSEVIAAKFVLAVAGAMLAEAALSFLGLGDPAMVSWGGMMHYAFKRGGFVNGMWYWYLPPGLCIAACAMGFLFLGLYFESRANKEVGSCNL